MKPTAMALAALALAIIAGSANAEDTPDRVGGVPIELLCADTIAGADNPMVLTSEPLRPGVEHARLLHDEGEGIRTEPGEVTWSLIEEPWGRIALGEIVFAESGIALRIEIRAVYPGMPESNVYEVGIAFDMPGSDPLPGFTEIGTSDTGCILESTQIAIRVVQTAGVGAVDLTLQRRGSLQQVADAPVISVNAILGDVALWIALSKGESGREVFDALMETSTAQAHHARAGLVLDQSAGRHPRRVFPGSANWSVIEVDGRPALEAQIRIDDLGFDWSVRIGSDADGQGLNWIRFVPADQVNAAAAGFYRLGGAGWGGSADGVFFEGVWEDASRLTMPDDVQRNALAEVLLGSQWIVFGIGFGDSVGLSDFLFFEITDENRSAFDEAFAAWGLIEADVAAPAE